MRNNTVRGIFYLALGVFVFSLQDAIIKKVSGSYALTEVVFIRSVVAMPILLAMVQREVGWRAIFSPQLWPMAMRAAILYLSYIAYYMAFPALPLADAVALYFTVPLFVTALAGPFLHEPSDRRVWLAVLVGFAGVMVMLQPSRRIFEPAALLSLLAAATYGLSMLMARKLGTSESATVMVFYQNVMFFSGSMATALALWGLGIVHAAHPSLSFLVRPWVWPAAYDALLMCTCGIVSTAGMMLLTSAYHVAKASVVTPFEYTGIMWAPLWGFLFFDEIPRLTTLAGAALIVGAGLVALHTTRTKNMTVQSTTNR
ncbi:MAG: DMT family transporter [Comamonadaceae bacterium]|nr:MAG: DMT family transporter [Comamonadaceae bacterium]